MRPSVYSGMGKSPPLGLGRSHHQQGIFTIPWCNTDSYARRPGVRAEPGVTTPVSVPEPSTLGLFAFGIASLFALRQGARRQSERAPAVCLWVSTLGQMDLRRASRALDLSCRM
jgi:hypothetical protein